MLLKLIFCIFFGVVVTKPTGLKKLYGGYLFQGDMIVRKDILDIALNGGDVDAKLKEEKKSGEPQTGQSAVGVTALKWTDGIVPYVISKDAQCKWYAPCLSSLGRPEAAIKSAIKEWERKTCIKFVKRTTQRDYVEFVNDGFGNCYSHVGRVIGRQVISLANGCSSHGIALHEIGHALGLHHEQSRPDRDDYVTINFDDIQSGTESNFKKYSFSKVNGLGSAYDYGSIMHYAKDAFGKWPWSTTIKTKNNAKIGQRKHLSTTDVATINKFYNCPAK